MSYLFVILLSLASKAETFKIAGTLIEFESKEGLLLKGCEKDCDALRMIKKHKMIDITKARKGMKLINSVGSDVCDKVYKGNALIGVTKEGDQRAFCFFKDQSMVELNSLSTYLVEKKMIK